MRICISIVLDPLNRYKWIELSILSIYQQDSPQFVDHCGMLLLKAFSRYTMDKQLHLSNMIKIDNRGMPVSSIDVDTDWNQCCLLMYR